MRTAIKRRGFWDAGVPVRNDGNADRDLGSWAANLFRYMNILGYSATQQAREGSFCGVSAFVAVFFGNQLADRAFSAERFLCVSHAISALSLIGVAFSTSFPGFFAFYFVYSILDVPTLSVTDAIGFADFKDPLLDFGRVWMGGTVGWVLASWPFVFLFSANASADDASRIVLVAAIISFAFALYSLALPHTLPRIAGADRLALCKTLGLLREPVINLVTRTPILSQFSGRVSGQYAPDNDGISQRTVRGVLNIPVGDQLAVFTSAYFDQVDEPTRNVLLEIDQRNKEYSFCGRVRLEPEPDVTPDIIAVYNTVRSDKFFNAYVCAVAGSPLPAQLAACGVIIGPDNTDKCGSGPTWALTKNRAVCGQINFPVGDDAITSMTAYREQDTEIQVDVDGLPGVFYSRYDSHHEPPSAVTIQFPFLPIAIKSDSLQTIHTFKQDYPIFSRATLNLIDRFRGNVGLHHHWSSIDDRFNQNGILRPLSEEVTNGSYRLGLAYEVSDHADLFATVTRGYTRPQANNIDVTRPPVIVRPEEPMAHEVGGKAGPFDGRLINSAAIYYAEITGYQAQFCRQVDVTNPTPRCARNNVDGVA